MASAPPSRSFMSNPHPGLTPLAAERQASDEARYQAWLKTPEGQEAMAKKAQAQEEAADALLETAKEMGWTFSDEDETQSHGSKGRKNKQKADPKKSTSFLTGLAQKFKGKNK